MKHALKFAAVPVLACAFLGTSPVAADCPATPGDVAPGLLDNGTIPPTYRIEGDGVVDVIDVIVLMRASASLHQLAWSDPTPTCASVPGDYSPGSLDQSNVPPLWRSEGDGAISIGDVLVLLRVSVGLQTLLEPDSGPDDQQSAVGAVVSAQWGDETYFAGVPGESGFVLNGLFFESDPDFDFGCEITEIPTSDCCCTITRLDCEFTLPDPQTPIDPGTPGTATNGSLTTQIHRQPADPLDPEAEGFFFPDESESELAQMGWGPGQLVRFNWPGGADVAPFELSVRVPGAIEVLSPNLSTPTAPFNLDEPLFLHWTSPQEARASNNTMTFVLATARVDVMTLQSTTVQIACDLPDSEGSYTIGRTLMAELLPRSTANLLFLRSEAAEVDVPFRGGPDTISVQALGDSGIRWNGSVP